MSDQPLYRSFERLLTRFIPNGVLVDQCRNVLHTFGDADKLLKIPPGRFGSDLAELVSGELKNTVIAAFQLSLKENDSVRLTSVETIKNDGEEISLEVKIDPLQDPATGSSHFLIQFVTEGNSPNQSKRRIRDLKQSQPATKNYQPLNPIHSSCQPKHGSKTELHEVRESLDKAIESLQNPTPDSQQPMQSTEIGFLFLNNTLRIQSFTPTIAKIFDVTLQDLGKKIEHFTSRIHNDDVRAEIKRVNNGESVKDKRVTLPDGKVYLRRILPYKDLDEVKKGIILAFVDITEFSATEAQLHDNEERVKLAATAARFGVWEWDLESNEMIWDEEMFRIYGISPTMNRHVNYTDWSTAVIPEDLPHQEEMIRKSVEGNTLIERHFRIIRRSDKQQRVVMAVEIARKDKEGKTISVVGINHDITEQRSVIERDTLLAAIVRNSSDGILTEKPDGQITSWNEGATQILQYSKEEIIGQNIRMIIPNSLQAEKDTIFQRIDSGKILTDFQTKRRRKDGQIIDVSISVFPVFNSQNNKVEYIASIMRDISENKRIQSKLQKADKLESLGVMARGIAHDFNNLLTGILANVSLALPESTSNAIIKESLLEIEDSTKQAADLCRQMLAYAGKTDSTLSHVNLKELTNNAITFITHSLRKNINVETLLPRETYFIKADAVQVQQVIVNLILNASEAFGHHEGDIELRLRKIDFNDPLIQEMDEGFKLKEGPHAALEIKDNGCGIRKEDLTKIFDPFFTTKFTGRGLGLPAIRGVLTAHNGALHVYSKLNIGSTFTVILPLEEPPSNPSVLKENKATSSDTPSAQNGKTLSSKSGQKNKCLIVDDQECIRRALSRLLKKNGYQEVFIASSGETGFEMFKEHQDDIDFVIVDLIMPGWNGAQTLSAIKNLNPNVPVVIMSGCIEDQVNETLKNGESPEGFLQKPFDEKGLLNCLKDVFSL